MVDPIGVERKANNKWQFFTYAVNISEKGRQLVDAWSKAIERIYVRLWVVRFVRSNSSR